MVHFRLVDTSEVVGEIDAIAAADGSGQWLTISPWVDPEHLPVVSVLRRLFSARASKVPEVTWVPATAKQPAHLGVLHGTGPHAVQRLVDAGVELPEGWSAIQDHSKRGLLFEIVADESAVTILEFGLECAQVLAEVPTDDRWIAQVSTPT